MIDIDNPLKWLLAELPNYLTSDQLAELHARFDVQKRRYYTAVKVRDLERKIKFAQHWPASDERAARLARWERILAQLKVEATE